MTTSPTARPSAEALPAQLAAEPVLRLVPFAFAEAFGRPAAGVWSAPYVLRLSGSVGGPGAAVPLAWRVVMAAAPRSDGVLRIGSINRPDEVAEIEPATGEGTLPDWAKPAVGGTTGAGGMDLLVHTDLPDCTGITPAVPLACTAALAESAFHATGPKVGRRAAVRLDDPPLGAVALFGRAGWVTLIEDDSDALEHLPFDPDRRGLRFMLAVPRHPDGSPHTHPTGIDAVSVDALAAGAVEARGLSPAGSTIAVVPGSALAAVRRAMVDTYTRSGSPAPRVLSATVGSPCVRVA
jgi:galactokinase